MAVALRWVISASVAAGAWAGLGAPELTFESAVQGIRAVGPDGSGQPAARAGYDRLAGGGSDTLPAILAAMDGANDYAINWLRAAGDAVHQREAAAGRRPPLGPLEAILRDTAHHPRARRLAYEWISEADPERGRRLLPGFLNDPSGEMRSDAVAQLAGQAAALSAGNPSKAIAGYQQALVFAREPSQIEEIAAKLASLGQKADLQKTFGWVTNWMVIGPFDNVGGAGFARPYPPESAVNPSAELEGKAGKVRWRGYHTADDYGRVDLNKPLSALKGVAAYAYAEFWSPVARPAQIRLGSENSWKVWVNGRFLFGRDEYHRAHEIDQYRLPFDLTAGRNTILVKCCQNEQTEDWASDWEFQLRVTDLEGAPLVSLPAPSP